MWAGAEPVISRNSPAPPAPAAVWLRPAAQLLRAISRSCSEGTRHGRQLQIEGMVERELLRIVLEFFLFHRPQISVQPVERFLDHLVVGYIVARIVDHTALVLFGCP